MDQLSQRSAIFYHSTGISSRDPRYVPDYFTDRNAMIAALQKLGVKQATKFVEKLGEIQQGCSTVGLSENQYTVFCLIVAPLDLMCEAYLRAIGEWVESDSKEEEE